MRNKKANIPITILVIGTIAVCIIALVAFHSAISKSTASLRYAGYILVLNKVHNYCNILNKKTCIEEACPGPACGGGVPAFPKIQGNEIVIKEDVSVGNWLGSRLINSFLGKNKLLFEAKIKLK